MDSRAKLFGHSIHQMLIVFPLGLLATAVMFDIAYLVRDEENLAIVAFWLTTAGIIGGLVAAPFGWIDWSAIPWGTRAKRVGLIHAGVNIVALLLFALSWYLRYDAPESVTWTEQLPSFGGLLLALVGGWLGGELVSRLGIAVHDGAHLNAPNSLSGRPATDSVGSRKGDGI